MKKVVLMFLAFLFIASGSTNANGPGGKNWGFGIVLGDPTGLTVKYWTNRENAFNFYIGDSYFGSPRIGTDYTWHFDVFKSNVVELYAGPGAVIGFGKGKKFWYKDYDGDKFYARSDSDLGIAIRGMVGVNVIPERTPIEIYLELGPLVGIIPEFGSTFEGAIGIRFYP